MVSQEETTNGSRVDAMRDAISATFPEPNRRLLQRLLQMMQVVASHKAENLMSISAVAACMAPLLLRPLLAGDCEIENEFSMVGGDSSLQLLQAAAAANNAQAIVITLLEEYKSIFSEGYSSESYSEGSGSEDVSTDDVLLEDDEYNDDEHDLDAETEEDDSDGEQDLYSETEDEHDDGHDHGSVVENGHNEGKDFEKEEHPPSKKNESPRKSGGDDFTDLDENKAIMNLRAKTVNYHVDDEIAIPTLESTKADLLSNIEKEAKENAVLLASLEKRKQSLHERRLALEDDVEKLQEQLQKEIDLKATLEAAATVPLENLPIPSSLDSKVKADIKELAQAESDVLNLTKKAADLQEQLSQQRRDNQDSAQRSYFSLHQETSKDQQNDVKVIPVENHFTGSPRSELNQQATGRPVNSDSASQTSVTIRRLPTNSIRDSFSKVTAEATPSSLDLPPQLQQLDLTSNSSSKSPLASVSSSTDIENMRKRNLPSSSRNLKPEGGRHSRTRSDGTISSSLALADIETPDPPTLTKKRASQKQETNLMSQSNRSIGDMTCSSADLENFATQNLTSSNRQPSLKKKTDPTSPSKAKSKGSTPILSTDTRMFAVNDTPQLQSHKMSQAALMSENIVKSTNAKFNLFTEELSKVGRNISSSKKNIGKSEVVGPLSKLTNRLNFKKEKEHRGQSSQEHGSNTLSETSLPGPTPLQGPTPLPGPAPLPSPVPLTGPTPLVGPTPFPAPPKRTDSG